jgi:DNA-binding MarR family transcriptional regulator
VASRERARRPTRTFRELADRAALISRSGMTRRVARPVDEGLVRRDRAGADARGVVVTAPSTPLLQHEIEAKAARKGARQRSTLDELFTGVTEYHPISDREEP